MEYLPERIPNECVETYVKISEYAGREFYRSVAVEIASLNPKRLLDIGTGHGILLSEILKLVRCECVGIDCTRKFFKYFTHYTKGKAYFVVADAYLLPFKNCSFDFVVSTGVLHALRFPERFFEEISRVLVSGGFTLVKDPTPLKMSLDRAKRILSDEEFEIFKTYRDFNIKLFGTEIPWTFEKEDVIEILKSSDTDFDLIKIDKRDGVLTILLRKS